MNNIIKAALIASAFVFAAGCATQSTPSTNVDTVANSQAHVSHNVHPAQLCHGKHCVDKLGNPVYKHDRRK
jgi:hypothetical protein